MKTANINFKDLFIGTISLFTLCACSTGGGTVLPSINGETALARACRNAEPDIIPNAPFKVQGFQDLSGIGSAGDGQNRFLEGFETIEFLVDNTALERANLLGPNDPSIWGLRPLSKISGIVNLGIVQRPHQGCDLFEEVVKSQGEPDAARFFTSTTFAPNPPRNWCINAFNYGQTAFEFSYSTNQFSSKEGESSLNQKIEILKRNGEIVARRTQIWLSRPQFPIGVVNVATGCDGSAITTPAPEFVGKNGIALVPLRAPTLIATSD